jgi:mannose-6-phosphate isomerase-like protein (cupin superfamily)
MTDITPSGFHPSAEAEQVTLGSGTVARFVAPGHLTRGEFGLFEWRMPNRTKRSGTHLHRTFSESFYIMQGTVSLFDGTQWVSASAGDYLYVPEGVAHGFYHDSDEPAAMLILFAPGAPREAYFRDLASIAATGRTLTDEEWVELWARHDQYPVSRD